jgi:hypothetical protein
MGIAHEAQSRDCGHDHLTGARGIDRRGPPGLASMKLRHAAVLALVGWYPMVPTPRFEGVPLSRWNHLQSYDTAKECEDGLTDWFSRNEKRGFVVKGFAAADVKSAWLEAQCIEADDPRLKSD